MKRIAFIGLGWMGESMAERCCELEYEVLGTTTSPQKKKLFGNKYTSVVNFKLGDSLEKLSEFTRLDFLVSSIPPSVSENYSSQIIEIFDYLLALNPMLKIIFISSTSVYGNKDRVVTETTDVQPQTKNAKKMVEVEDYLFVCLAEKMAIFRCGGLVGKQRHPATHLAGKSEVAKPLAAVNLVHLADVLGIFLHSLNDFKSGVYNLVSPEHPLKEEFYNWATERMGLQSINFQNEDRKDKIVTSPAVKQLGYNYLFPTPYEFPLP